MKPTKEEYAALLAEWDKGTEKLRSCGYEEQTNVDVMRMREIVDYVLRIAANMPSENELKTIVFHYTGDPQYPDYSGAAVAILKRLGVEG